MHYQVCFLHKGKLKHCTPETYDAKLAHKWYTMEWAITGGWEIQKRRYKKIIESRKV